MTNSVNFIQRVKNEQQNAEHYIQAQRIKVLQILKQAWQLTTGARVTLISAFIVCLMIGAVVSLGLKAIFPKGLSHLGLHILELLAEFAVQIFILYPLAIGSKMLSVNRARGNRIALRELFAYFQKPIFWQVTKWILWMLLIGISLGILFIATLLLVVGLGQIMGVVKYYLTSGAIAHNIVPNSLWVVVISFSVVGLYLWWSYSYALQLIADKKLHAGFALTVSRKAFNRNFLPIMGFGLIMIVIIIGSLAAAFFLPKPFNLAVIGVLILIIAFVVMPWASVVNGLIYHSMIKSPDINNQ